MPELLSDFFSLSFVVRALVVGIMVSLCASLLGVSLVLKRYSMIGDGLSHVGFGTLAIAVALDMTPLKVSLPLVLFAAFILLRISDSGKIQGDAAIALISGSSLAIGVIILSLKTGMNTDINNYMFGTILAMSTGDLYLSVAVSVAVLALYILSYNRIFAVTFDESFAKAAGINTELYNMLLAALTALVIVVGMRMMGAMLISSLIVFPPLTSMRVFGRFKSVAVCSAVLSAVCFFAGILFSFAAETPAGASVVVMNLAAFCVFTAAGRLNVRRKAGN